MYVYILQLNPQTKIQMKTETRFKIYPVTQQKEIKLYFKLIQSVNQNTPVQKFCRPIHHLLLLCSN